MLCLREGLSPGAAAGCSGTSLLESAMFIMLLLAVSLTGSFLIITEGPGHLLSLSLCKVLDFTGLIRSTSRSYLRSKGNDVFKVPNTQHGCHTVGI